jgi:glycosyltransferase involved in cell wall biosynthesis
VLKGLYKVKLMVVVPIYNEERLLPRLLSELSAAKKLLTNTDFLIVNDGSTDNSLSILSTNHDIEFMNLPSNLGKGGAVRAGIANANSDFIAIFDGDLEYGVTVIQEFDQIVEVLTNDVVVFGSRYLNKNVREIRATGIGWNSILMNKVLLMLYKILFGVTLTDPLTGAKLYPSEAVKSLNLIRDGFDADHEIALKLAKKGLVFIEVPVAFSARNRAEGKKIRGRDAVLAIRTVLKEYQQGRRSLHEK